MIPLQKKIGKSQIVSIAQKTQRETQIAHIGAKHVLSVKLELLTATDLVVVQGQLILI